MPTQPNTPVSDARIVIELPRAQALVLYEFLARFSDDQKHKLEIQDQAEERVLWDMCCDLEKALGEQFRPDYAELLKKAREAVRDKDWLQD